MHCKNCGKVFEKELKAYSFFNIKKNPQVLEQYIECMFKKYSTRKTAEICNINLITAQMWRQKILNAIQKILNDEEFNDFLKNSRDSNMNLPKTQFNSIIDYLLTRINNE